MELLYRYKFLFFSFLLSLLMFVFAGSLTAQDDYNWSFFVNGSQVNDIAGANGEIWVATNGGVAHIDASQNITRYNAGNTPLESNYVRSVEIDNDGALWVGTDGGGLYRLYNDAWRGLTTENSILTSGKIGGIAAHGDTVYVGLLDSDGKVAKIADGNVSLITINGGIAFNTFPGISAVNVDANGVLWVGSEGEGIAKVENGVQTLYEEDETDIPGHNEITDIEFSTDGTVWLTTDLGDVVSFDGETTWTEYDNFNSDLPGDALDLAFDSDNLLWIATENGLYSFDGTSFIGELPSDATIGTNLRSIYIDESGSFWAGSSNNEIASFDGSAWQRIRISGSGVPKDAETRSMMFDSDGNLWITIDYVDGIVMYDGSEWTHFDGSNSPLSRDDIHTVEEGPDGTIWAGSGYFLYKYDGTEWSTDDQIENGDFLDFHTDTENNVMWAATQNGLWKWENDSWTQFDSTDEPMLDEDLLAVHATSEGNVWVSYGSFGSNGLISYDGSEWTVFDSEDYGLTDFQIIDIESDLQGNLWLGNYYGGLIQFDGNEFKEFSRENSALTGGRVKNVELDLNGNLWLTTANYQGSVVRYDRSGFKVFTPDNSPLTNHFVEALVIDENGDKWIGNEEGEVLRLEGGMQPSANISATVQKGVAPLDVSFSHPGNSDYYSYQWTFDGGSPATSNEAKPTVGYTAAGSYSVTLEVTNAYGTATETKAGFITVLDETSPDENYWVNYANGSIVSDVEQYGDEFWIGTNGGVAVYNRVDEDYRYLNLSNTPITTNQINDIAINASGKVWLATKAGLFGVNGDEWEHYTAENSDLPVSNVTTLYISGDDKLWLGTSETSFFTAKNQGLISFDGSTWTVETSTLAENGEISAIVEDNDGNFWIGLNGNGVAKFDGSTITETFTISNSQLPDGNVNAITIDSEGKIWVGSQAGLAHYDGSAWTTLEIDGSFSNLSIPVEDLDAATNGDVWVGTSSYGLFRYRDGDLTIFDNENADIASNKVQSVFVDDEQHVWSGTEYTSFLSGDEELSALTEYDGINWIVHEASATPLPSNTINEIETDGNGGVWFSASPTFDFFGGDAAQGALIHLNGSEWQVYNPGNSPIRSDDQIGDIFVDSQGQVWLTQEDRILKLDDGAHWEVFDSDDLESVGDNVNGVTETEDGHIWALGSGVGIYEYDGESWTKYEPSSFSFGSAEHIEASADGTIWIGSFDTGIYSFDGNSWSEFSSSNSNLTENAVEALYSDNQGNVWAALNNLIGGSASLFKYESGEWTTQDLPENVVSIGSLTTSADGKTWISCKIGSFGDSTPTLAFKEIGEFILLSKDNTILPDSDFETITVDTEGRVWLGTSNAGLFVHSIGATPTNAEDASEIANLPLEIQLKSNYPNPFNPATTIPFELAEGTKVKITVFDILGRKIQTLVNSRKSAGTHSIQFDARSLASGTYLYRLEAGGEVHTGKMLLIK